MVSKKEMLILGAVAVGGLGLASMLASGEGEEEEGGGGMRLVGIPGISSEPAIPAPGNIYNFPPEPEVSFPAMPSFDWSAFFPSAGGVGVTGGSVVSKKESIVVQQERWKTFFTPGVSEQERWKTYFTPGPSKKESSSSGDDSGGWGVGTGAGSAPGGGFTASEEESYFAGGG